MCNGSYPLPINDDLESKYSLFSRFTRREVIIEKIFERTNFFKLRIS